MKIKDIKEEVSKRHGKSFDQHYQKWGYIGNINEFIVKKGLNKVLFLNNFNSVKNKVIENLIVKDNKIRILDVGCGYGFLLQKLKSRYQKNIKLDMYGTDLSQFMIENAKRNVAEGMFRVCPAELLPFDDDYFENVVCSEVIEHVIDPKKTVHELARVTANKGNLIITTPNYSGYTLSILRFLKKYAVIPPLHKLGAFLQRYSDFTVKNEDIPLRRLKAFLKENNAILIKVIYLIPLSDQKIFFPMSTNLWIIMVKATKILEKIPILNRIICNQIVLLTRKEKNISDAESKAEKNEK